MPENDDFIDAGIYKVDANNIKPEDDKTKLDAPKTSDEALIPEKDNQEKDLDQGKDNLHIPDSGDKLTISKEDQILKLPDGSEIAWKELEGQRVLKSRYDQQVKELNDEKETLLAAKEEIESSNQWIAEDLPGYLEAHIKLGTDSLGYDPGSIIHSLIEKVNSAYRDRGIKLGLVDNTDPENPRWYNPKPHPKWTYKPPETAQKPEEHEVFKQRLRADRAEALPSFGTEITPEIIRKAEELYKEQFKYCESKDKDNPFRYALKFAMIESGKSPTNKSSPKENTTVTKKTEAKRTGLGNPNVSVVDEDEKKFIKYGIYSEP